MMNRVRRRLLSALLCLPALPIFLRAIDDQEYVVIDGWVMKRNEVGGTISR